MAFDFAAQQAALARRRQLADMLQKQSMTGLRVPAGSRASPFDALGDIALAWSAKRERDSADADEKRLSADQGAALEEMLTKFPTGTPAREAIPGGEAESAEGGGQTPGLPAQAAQPATLKDMLGWATNAGKLGPWGEKIGAEVADQALKYHLPNQLKLGGGAGIMDKNAPVLQQRYEMALQSIKDQYPDMDPVQQTVHARRIALNDISVTQDGSAVSKSGASVGSVGVAPGMRQGDPAPSVPTMIPRQGVPAVPGARPASPPPMLPRSTDEMPPLRAAGPPPAAAPTPVPPLPAPQQQQGAQTAPLAPPPNLNEQPGPAAPVPLPTPTPGATQFKPNGQPFKPPQGGPVFAALTEKIRAEQPARDGERMRMLTQELATAQGMPPGPERDQQVAALTTEIRQTDANLRGVTPPMRPPATLPGGAPPPMLPTAAAPPAPTPMLPKAPAPDAIPVAAAPRAAAPTPAPAAPAQDNPYLPRPAIPGVRSALPRQKDPEPEIRDYGKRLNDDEIPALGQAFAQLDAVFKSLSLDPNTGLTMTPDGQPGGNVPGYGGPMGVFNLSQVKFTPEGQAIQTAYAPLSNIILNARSGKAVTDSELKRHLKEVGQAFGQDDKAFWQAYAQLKNYVGIRKATIDQSFHPYIREQFAARGAAPAKPAGEGKSLSAVEKQYGVKFITE